MSDSDDGTAVFYDPNLLPWEHFVACSGEPGARWVADYCAARLGEITLRTARAVDLLRKERFDEAVAEFAEVRDAMGRLAPDPPEWRSVLRRFYLAAFAYYRYLTADYENAKADIDGAQEAVETAIRQQPLLLPLAQHCLELQIQRARIARAERRWDAVQRCCGQLLALADDRRPLCSTGGEPLYFSALGRYLLNLPRLTAEERERLAKLVDKQACIESIERYSLRLYAPPGLVIPYP